MTKKILIVTDNLPDQINGVVTTYKNIEAMALLDGYHVDYIHPGRFRYIDCPKYNEVKLTFTKQVGKTIREINPNYIHIATEGPLGLSARKYLTKRGIRYNTAYHTKFPEGLKALFNVPEKFTWAFVRWFHKHSECVLTTTSSMVDELKAHKFKGHVVPWTRGVDRNVFTPALREQLPAKYLLCVARVSKEKNLEDFFELDYPGYQKIMVGDGPMLDSYKKKYPDVHFTGFKTGVDLARYYANAEVFVFPSQWETFGIVMIEAMACGTPVAAYNCQGPRDVIDQGITGFMADTNEGLKVAVDKCLEISRHSVHQASQRWTWLTAWEIFRDSLITVK